MSNTAKFYFEILHKDKKTQARIGRIITAHGTIETPAFTPVGTQGTVKGISPFELKEIGAQLIFGNTYHLHLKPGEDVVKKFGGLAKFMSWNGPTITDSGGFQVFSLGKIRKWGNNLSQPAESFGYKSQDNSVSPSEIRRQDKKKSNDYRLSDFNSPQIGQVIFPDEPLDELVKIFDHGVKFRSHHDGSLHEFTPEKSIEIQHKLGADMILAFDQCPPNPSSYDNAKKAVGRTNEWLKRCIAYHKKNNKNKQAFLGIVQGSIYDDLRKQSAEFVTKQDVDAIAIGGVAVGETKEEMRKALKDTMPFLPEEKYKHLLGVGEVDDIFDVVAEGIDSFDCVIPTRFGRYGIVFAYPPVGNIRNRFRLDLNKTVFAADAGQMVEGCRCKVCKSYKRGYLHHLFKANELLAYRLASYHNIYFLTYLIKQIRESILNGTFSELRTKWFGIP